MTTRTKLLAALCAALAAALASLSGGCSGDPQLNLKELHVNAEVPPPTVTIEEVTVEVTTPCGSGTAHAFPPDGAAPEAGDGAVE
jgi:hypothetical protein